jgi:hypothetical protein
MYVCVCACMYVYCECIGILESRPLVHIWSSMRLDVNLLVQVMYVCEYPRMYVCVLRVHSYT